MTELYVFAGIVVLLLALIAITWWSGRQSARSQEAKDDARVKDKQLEIANSPPDKSALDQRLSRDDF